MPADWAVPVTGGVAAPEAALAYLAGHRRLRGPARGAAGGATRSSCWAPGRSARSRGGWPRCRRRREVTVVARSRRREAAARRRPLRRGLAEGRGPRGRGAAVVIEATGDPAAIAPAVAAARAGGTVVLLGSPRGIDARRGAGRPPAPRVGLVGAHISALATEAQRHGGDPFAALAREVPRTPSPPGGSTRPISRARRSTARARSTSIAASRAARPTPRTWTGRRCRPRSGSGRGVLPGAAGAPAPLPAPAAARGARALRFAVIGCGDIGLANARAVAAAANAEVVLCHDAAPCARGGGRGPRSAPGRRPRSRRR